MPLPGQPGSGRFGAEAPEWLAYHRQCAKDVGRIPWRARQCEPPSGGALRQWQANLVFKLTPGLYYSQTGGRQNQQILWPEMCSGPGRRLDQRYARRWTPISV